MNVFKTACFVCCVLVVCSVEFAGGVSKCARKSGLNTHTVRRLSTRQSRALAAASQITALKRVFHSIYRIRTVGSVGHAIVKNYIIRFFRKLNWRVELHRFRALTPLGVRQFTNIIARRQRRQRRQRRRRSGRNPAANPFSVPPHPSRASRRRLVLACHYDSKLQRNFFGATDSVMPCAIIMNMARILDTALAKKATLFQQNDADDDVDMELVFFDGEEAFHRWSARDSLYGSRGLAAHWSRSFQRFQRGNVAFHCSKIQSIEMLILLDLIGASRPRFYRSRRKNKTAFQLIRSIEKKLARLGVFKSRSDHPYFSQTVRRTRIGRSIQDDHLPFEQRGVLPLHLIPVPFPAVWHTELDRKEKINFNTSLDLQMILTEFLAVYMKLNDYVN